MVIAVGKSVAKIVALIAFPGAGIIANFLEFGLQVIALLKGAYYFLKEKI